MDDELLAFPPEMSENTEVQSLTDEELIIVRKMIADYKKNSFVVPSNENIEIKPNSTVSNLFETEEDVNKPVTNSLFSEEPIVPPSNLASESARMLFSDETVEQEDEKNDFSELLNSCKNYETSEVNILNEFKEIFSKIELASKNIVLTAFLGLFPCKRFVRHGTPEQKLFVLKCLSDRFLENISGLKFSSRKRLLKLISKYLSDTSEYYNFISMEGEPFKPTFHERVSGASSSGLIIKEMRGFLVVDNRTNHIIYTGLVLS